MRATHGTAIYTGGGIYNVIGETDNGYWFFGGPDWCTIVDSDIREEDKENDDDLVCYYNDWLEKHEVKVNVQEIYEMFEDFCRRLDAKEPGITDGYEKFSNYAAGEVTDYIDFSEFVDYQPDGKIIIKGVTLDEVGCKLTMEIINNGLLNDFSYIVQTLKKIDSILAEIDNDKEHKGYYIGFNDPNDFPLIEKDQGNLSNKDNADVWYKIVYTNGDYNLYKIENE